MHKIARPILGRPVRIGSRNLQNRAPHQDLRLPTRMREPFFRFTRHTLNASVTSIFANTQPISCTEEERSKIVTRLLIEYHQILNQLTAKNDTLSQKQAIADLLSYFLDLEWNFILQPPIKILSDDDAQKASTKLTNCRIQLGKLSGILNGDPYRHLPEKVDLWRLVANLMPEPENDSVHYRYEVPDGPPIFLFSDPSDTALILENFFANSVRACERKGIFPFIEVVAFILDNHQGMTEIRIGDKGIGFRDGELFRVRHSKGFTSKETDNTDHGIGLEHCRFLIEQHGGKLDISSKRGEGTDVIFTLPIYLEE